MKPIIRLFLIVSVAFIFARLVGWPVLERLAIVLSLFLGLAYLVSRMSLRGLTMVREGGSVRTRVGEVMTEQLMLRNRALFGKAWLDVRDQSTLPGHDASRAVQIRGRAAESWFVTTPCVRRGHYRLGPAIVQSGDPFGLFPFIRRAPAFRDVLVGPAVVGLRGFQFPGSAMSGGRTVTRGLPMPTPSVAGVRDYVTGDPLSRISWSSSARLGRLMVKEFDSDPASDVWLVLDLDQATRVAARNWTWPPLDGSAPLEAWLDATDEYAVTLAASLAARATELGLSVGLIASGRRDTVLIPERSDRQLTRILDHLAVAYNDGPRPLAETLIMEETRFKRNDVIVVLTSSTDDAWVSALAGMAMRRIRPIVVHVEPSTFAPFTASLGLIGSLASASIRTYLVKQGEPIAAALAEPVIAGVGVTGDRYAVRSYA